MPFKLHSPYAPAGDQPQAIQQLTEGSDPRFDIGTPITFDVTLVGAGKGFEGQPRLGIGMNVEPDRKVDPLQPPVNHQLFKPPLFGCADRGQLVDHAAELWQ